MIKKIFKFIYSYFNYIFIIKSKNNDLKIMNSEETINYILKNKVSFCRYGDGEFKWMLNIKQDSFQDYSEELRKELIKIINSKKKNVLLGIPLSMKSIKNAKLTAKRYWVEHYTDCNNEIKSLLNNSILYGNSEVTRPYIDYQNIDFQIKFNNLKKLWDNKKILIVEGEKTKLGVGNDLFNNAKKIKRILCPATNAYSIIDNIEKKVLKYKDNYDIVLIALGPTATILAYRLAMKNIWSIDVGHIDIEYEWFLMNANKKVPIPGKYVNETKEIFINNDEENKKYNSQILTKVGV